MKPEHGFNRRRFLQNSTTLAAAIAVLPTRSPLRAGANEKVVVGLMGAGGRGSTLAGFFAKRPDVEIAYVCDADSRRLPTAQKVVEQAQGKVPKAVQDFRRILEDKHVDVLVNATPDHWHGLGTILACQAGKDVYVEKPLSHNAWEGRKMIEASRKYERVVQVGTQSRSAPYLREAVEWIRAGKLGDVLLVRVFNMMQQALHKSLREQPVPEGFDYDLWCGPAPKLPYDPGRVWLDYWEYSCGAIPGDAIHQLDLARALIGDPPAPETVSHSGGVFALRDDREIPDTQFVTYEYGKMTLLLEAALWTPYMKKTPMELRDVDDYPNWAFNATRIEVVGTRNLMYFGRHGDGWQVFDADWKQIAGSPAKQSDHEHIENFIQGVKNRKRPNSDVEQGHYSTLLSHLANISYRMGNRKLQFDAKSESFPGMPEANKWLRRTYRAPWVVPEEV
ncbi:MAG TPA: Gfo/Idh/MocA family oxidoreductase [Candidatus Limnocylindrales bacterium]|jgi:predicted dehydrogenase|nr:Gfo/Idh/MocA family oxidoreductase [Candidatus Limnocylindrales bacterium]